MNFFHLIFPGANIFFVLRPPPYNNFCNGPSLMGAFHLVKMSGISGWSVNGTRFVGWFHWKISRKSGKSQKVGPFSWLDFFERFQVQIWL